MSYKTVDRNSKEISSFDFYKITVSVRSAVEKINFWISV